MSKIEETIALHIRAAKLPRPVRQHAYLPNRKFLADFAWPDRKLALEVDGMVHRIKARFEADAERHNTLLEAGWRVYRVTGKMVRSGAALALIERVLA